MWTHLFRQGPVISSSLGLVLFGQGDGPAEASGEVIEATATAPPAGLVRDLLRVVGADSKSWGGNVPPYLYPQWTWPLLTRALKGLPYDFRKMVNAGCSWRVGGPIAPGAALQLRARRLSIDEDERRALVTVALDTSTADAPDALMATMTVFAPKVAPAKGSGPKRARPVVPEVAVQVAERRLRAGMGMDFAMLTGDINPLHWLGPYAKAAGFGGVILHGFATMAVGAEGLVAGRLAGDTARLRGLSCRLVSPLRLPATVGVFLDGDQIYVGSAPGGPAFLTGEVELG